MSDPTVHTSPAALDAYTKHNEHPVKPGIGLCMSGGGYRAMLFHLGTLWRLNEIGILPKISRVSSVSGGSITAGLLGANWSNLTFAGDVATNFDDFISQPLLRFSQQTEFNSDNLFSEIGSFIGGLLNHKVVIDAYRKYLYGGKTLQDLPLAGGEAHAPEFVFNATNLMSGSLWRFTRAYMADYQVGMVLNPTVDLATAVAASSAFPIALPPVYLPLNEADVINTDGARLHEHPYNTKAILVDGGVYDNLGIEAVFKEFRMVLVSNASGPFGPKPNVALDGRDIVRILGITNDQVDAVRERWLVASYQLPHDQPGYREGAYWGISTDISHYPLTPDRRLDCPIDRTTLLAEVPTVLSKLDLALCHRLVNWGYAVCDAAIRSYCIASLAQFDVHPKQPTDFPFPDDKV